jgi:hypothetical protein
MFNSKEVSAWTTDQKMGELSIHKSIEAVNALGHQNLSKISFPIDFYASHQDGKLTDDIKDAVEYVLYVLDLSKTDTVRNLLAPKVHNFVVKCYFNDDATIKKAVDTIST